MKSSPVIQEREQGLESILERARAGDREAFDRLIQRFERQVMKTAFYLTRNLNDAQDVAQEVYIKIFRYLPRVQPEKLAAWIYRITVNAAYDFQRRHRLVGPIRKLFSVSKPVDGAAANELRDRLFVSLGKLSFRERAAFILRELEELETTEVAEALGCSEVTVRGYVHSARRKLQEHLRDFRE